MSKDLNIRLLALIIFFTSLCVKGESQVEAQPPLTMANQVDFIHYQADIRPNFDDQLLDSKVNITFTPRINGLKQLVIDGRFKQFHSVAFEEKPAALKIIEGRLVIDFKSPLSTSKSYQLEAVYSANPKRGLEFFDDHMFTVYHTKHWLLSHSDIGDKASFDLTLQHKEELTSVGNGKLIGQTTTDNGIKSTRWSQSSPIPVYTFGFALGKFDKIEQQIEGNRFSYLYRSQSDLTPEQIKQVFIDTGDMLAFFTDKAGFALPNKSYSYAVVNGYMAQEADGFSLVGEKFVEHLLKDEQENWFVAHELAHEWWGNSITCTNFSHFWLNEGLVQFLVAAYKQHLFGQGAYEREINLALRRVDKAVDRGANAPVAFKQPIDEKEINRSMVYSKGALVFHMLRQELGDELFWQSLRSYSRKYQGQSVTTEDLQNEFERVSKRKLEPFFETWVYGTSIPEISFSTNDSKAASKTTSD